MHTQVPVLGGCGEEPAQAPGLTGEAPWGQACHAAEEHQGGSQLVSVDASPMGESEGEYLPDWTSPLT